MIFIFSGIARRRPREESSSNVPNNCSYKFFVKVPRDGKAEEVIVCAKAFVSIFGITDRRLRTVKEALSTLGKYFQNYLRRQIFIYAVCFVFIGITDYQCNKFTSKVYLSNKIVPLIGSGQVVSMVGLRQNIHGCESHWDAKTKSRISVVFMLFGKTL